MSSQSANKSFPDFAEGDLAIRGRVWPCGASTLKVSLNGLAGGPLRRIRAALPEIGEGLTAPLRPDDVRQSYGLHR